jgi:hypothetical protein
MITHDEQRPAKFKIHEIVHVLAQPPRIHQNVLQKEGIVLGWSEPTSNSCRHYAVHINDYGETFAMPEDALESIGCSANQQAITSRSRANGRKRASRKFTHNGQNYDLVAEELANGKYTARIDSPGVVGCYIRQPDFQMPDPKTGKTTTKQGPPVEFDTQEAGFDAAEENIRLGMI